MNFTTIETIPGKKAANTSACRAHVKSTALRAFTDSTRRIELSALQETVRIMTM
jgi:hypothetical protein